MKIKNKRYREVKGIQRNFEGEEGGMKLLSNISNKVNNLKDIQQRYFVISYFLGIPITSTTGCFMNRIIENSLEGVF